jgi:methionine-S-sulfoxide reductase
MPRALLLPLLAVALPLAAMRCAGPTADAPSGEAPPEDARPADATAYPSGPVGASVSPADPDTALFAAGCFWCAETAFEGREGVLAAISGFAGGTVASPTYDEVSRGGTGHAEAVLVIYDPALVSYQDLLTIYWHNVDPLTANAQFCDRGEQYRSAIFALDAGQQLHAEASFAEVEARFEEPVVTELDPASPFYPAEEYHQDFYRKDPDRYHTYREGCGRDARLRQLWGEDAGRDAQGRPDAVH